MRSARRSSRTSGVLRLLSGTATRFWTVNGRSAGRDSGAGGTGGTGPSRISPAGLGAIARRTRCKDRPADRSASANRSNRSGSAAHQTHPPGRTPPPPSPGGGPRSAGRAVADQRGGWRTASPGQVPAGILAQFAHPNPVHRRTIAHAVLLVTTTPEASARGMLVEGGRWAMSTELFLTKLGAWTLDDLAQLPDDGRRYEIIDGSLLVSPPPSNYHQGLAFDSVARLVSHRHPLGLATVKPAAGSPGGSRR